jgi:hypothetical protein
MGDQTTALEALTDEALSKPDAAAGQPTIPGPGGSEDQACAPGGPPVLLQLGRPQPRSA